MEQYAFLLQPFPCCLQPPVEGIGTEASKTRQNRYRGGMASFDRRFTYLKEGGLMSTSPGPGGYDCHSFDEPCRSADRRSPTTLMVRSVSLRPPNTHRCKKGDDTACHRNKPSENLEHLLAFDLNSPRRSHQEFVVPRVAHFQLPRVCMQPGSIEAFRLIHSLYPTLINPIQSLGGSSRYVRKSASHQRRVGEASRGRVAVFPPPQRATGLRSNGHKAPGNAARQR